MTGKKLFLFQLTLLAGKRGKYETENGEKFIAVEAGGKLEIHGQQRRFRMEHESMKMTRHDDCNVAPSGGGENQIQFTPHRESNDEDC